MSIFSERVKSSRQKKQISQQKMADLLGISRTAYNNYESGLREPTHERLCMMSDIFDVSLDYLLGRVEDPALYVKIAPTEYGDAIVKVQGPAELTLEELEAVRQILAERRAKKTD